MVAGRRWSGAIGRWLSCHSLGIRMLDQPYMTGEFDEEWAMNARRKAIVFQLDLIEANSMGHEPDIIDIYSASWGERRDRREGFSSLNSFRTGRWWKNGRRASACNNESDCQRHQRSKRKICFHSHPLPSINSFLHWLFQGRRGLGTICFSFSSSLINDFP